MICTKLKRRIVSALVFEVMKIRKTFQSMYQKKCYEEKHVDLLLIEEERKRSYILIKDSNTFKCDHTLYLGRKYFSC